MKQHVELYEYQKHYSMLALWWRRHGFNPVPPACLSSLGVIVFLDDVPRAAAWGYRDSSSAFAFVDFVVANPANKPRQSAVAIKLSVECVTEILSKNGAIMIMTAFKNNSISRLIEPLGYHKNETGVTTLMRVKQ